MNFIKAIKKMKWAGLIKEPLIKHLIVMPAKAGIQEF